MTAGTPLDINTVNRLASAYTVALRNVLANINNFNDNLTAIGGQGYLEGIGMTPDDSFAVASAFTNLATGLYVVYIGGVSAVNLPFDFRGDTKDLWGGS